MKQTEIYYRKISPNVIKITNLKNALSLREIREQFGDAVINEYKKGARYFISYIPNTVLYIKKEPFNRQVTADSIMTKQEFSEIITTMKEAGERLRQIIAENKIVENWGKKKVEKNNENKKINLPIKRIEGDNDFFKIVVNLNIKEMIKIMPVPALNDLRKKITDEIATRNIVGETGTRIFIDDVNDINNIYKNTPHEKIKEWFDNAALNIVKEHKTKKEEVKTIKI